jgi:Fe2+ or Zn2+ uptake regulation protein
MNDQPKLFDMDHQGTFYNTIEETEAQLDQSRAHFTLQEKRILAIMGDFPKGMTPFEVWSLYCAEYAEVPVTSVRRAITNLTNAGYLERTERQVKERWGKSNYVWKIKVDKIKDF